MNNEFQNNYVKLDKLDYILNNVVNKIIEN